MVVVDELPSSSSSSSGAAPPASSSPAPRCATAVEACSRAASRRPSARGSSIRGAAGWSTSCPRRCTASCASTATATRSRRTSSERLARLCVAVAGLSVGRAVVSTLAHEGIGGELRLADFDVLDLSNLNRVTGGVADVGVSKVVLAAREVAELDPYIRVVAFPRGVRGGDDRDVRRRRRRVVDECDGLEIKLLLREHARAARPAGGDGHEPSRDARRRALRPRARAAAVPRAARRRHLGRAAAA